MIAYCILVYFSDSVVAITLGKKTLRIIAKSRMSNDDCYLGLADNGAIYRPIYRWCLSWFPGHQLQEDKLYTFTLSGVDYRTALPHRHQDRGTNEHPDVVDEGNTSFNIYDTLLPLAVDSIDGPFVVEGTDCPSAFVLKADGARFFTKDYDGKPRVEVGAVDYPYTGYDFKDRLIIDGPILVVLEYARKLGGNAELMGYESNCYLLAVRIVRGAGTVSKVEMVNEKVQEIPDQLTSTDVEVNN